MRTPNDVREELARIFAAAILTLHRRNDLTDESSRDGQTCLEVPAETVLSDHHG